MKKPEPAQSDETHHEAINKLLLVQEKLIRIAQDNQHEHDVYVVSQRSKDQPHTIHFPINSYVLVNYETQKSSKLHTVKHGPYRVINRIGTVYTVENLVTNKHMDFHVTLLTEYKNDERNTNIDKVAKLDDEFADVAEVINHKFVPSTSTKKPTTREGGIPGGVTGATGGAAGAGWGRTIKGEEGRKRGALGAVVRG